MRYLPTKSNQKHTIDFSLSIRRQLKDLSTEIIELLDELITYKTEYKEVYYGPKKTYECEKYLLEYLNLGYNFSDAVKRVLALHPEFYNVDFSHLQQYFNCRIKPYKIYAAKKMIQADIPIKKISQILQISEATVRKYLVLANYSQ